jgi:hypothetical protein
MSAFRVRRGISTFGASADSVTEAISPAYTVGQSFALLGSFHGASAGYAGASVVDDTRDFSAWPSFNSNDDELELNLEALAATVDFVVPWELVEFTGSQANPHAIEVIATGAIRMLPGASSGTSGVLADVGEVAACIPFLAGQDYQGAAASVDSNRKVTLKIQADGRILAERSGTAGTIFVYYALVRFGSAWTVQNNIEHTFIAAGSVETEAISAVDWTHTFVAGAIRGPGDGLDESGAVIFPGTSTQISLQLRSGASSPSSFAAVCHVASNPLMDVQHADSVAGGGTEHATGDSSVIQAILTVDTARTFLLGSNDCAGTGTGYPRQYWGFTLYSATEVAWSRARKGQPSAWAIQVIELPDLDELAPAAADLELGASSPASIAGSQDLAPAAADLELGASSPASIAGSQDLAPAAADLELGASSPASIAGSQDLAPAAADLELGASSPASIAGSQDLAPAAADLELGASSPASIAGSQDLAPAAADLELGASSPVLSSGYTELIPVAADISLQSGRASLDAPGLCRLGLTLPITVEQTATLELAELKIAAPLAETIDLAVKLVEASLIMPISSTLSASLTLCP